MGMMLKVWICALTFPIALNHQTQQGTLSALEWPHVFVADSLAMGEAAVKMAATGEVCEWMRSIYIHVHDHR